MNNNSNQYCGMTHSEAGKLGHEKIKEKLKQKHLMRIETYNQNPKKCLQCSGVIQYNKRTNKFCSHSCSAIYSNTKRGITYKKIYHKKACITCGKLTKNETYCSVKCQHKHFRDLIWNEILISGSANGYTPHLIRVLLLSYRGIQCEICHLKIWNDQPIPVVIDHIDGHHENNSLNNLRIICCNCDALLPTYKGKNKGNGRLARRKKMELRVGFEPT
jgi:hypothetical protein